METTQNQQQLLRPKFSQFIQAFLGRIITSAIGSFIGIALFAQPFIELAQASIS
jgi:hypothetical protein